MKSLKIVIVNFSTLQLKNITAILFKISNIKLFIKSAIKI